MGINMRGMSMWWAWWGRPWGRGWCWFWAVSWLSKYGALPTPWPYWIGPWMSPEAEKDYLKREKEYLLKRLEEIDRRLKELES